MNRVLALTAKDLVQLCRDKMTLFWALGFPLVFGVLFGAIYASSDDGPKASKLILVDQDQSKESIALGKRLAKSEAIKLSVAKLDNARDTIRKGEAAAYLVVPKGWGEADRAFRGGTKPMKLGIDPSKKAETGILQGVVTEAVFKGMSDRYSDPASMKESANKALSDIAHSNMDSTEKASMSRFMNEVVRFSDSRSMNQGGNGGASEEMSKIETESVTQQQQGSHPMSSFEITFPQGILWGLMSLVAQFSISLVRERQQGTMARLLASPMRFGEILLGQALACFLSCITVMGAFMALGALAFHVRITSVPMVSVAIIASSVCFVGIMVLMSTLAKTTQAASGSVWGILMVFAMFGGGMIPAFMMPSWMQAISNFSPVKWSGLAMEGAIWRGFSAAEMAKPVGVLLAVGAICFALGVRKLSLTRDY